MTTSRSFIVCLISAMIFIAPAVPASAANLEAAFEYDGAVELVIDADMAAQGYTGEDKGPIGAKVKPKLSNDGAADKFELILKGEELEVTVNGVMAARSSLPAVSRIVINGSADDDTLVLDNSGGLIAPPGGIHFIGEFLGVNRGAGDTLYIVGDPFSSPLAQSTYTPTGSDSGIIVLDPDGSAGDSAKTFVDDEQVIIFSGLAPIIDLFPVTNMTFIAGTGIDTIEMVDGVISSGLQTTELNDGGTGTFESYSFANKQNLTINFITVDQNNQITINNPTPADGLVTVELNGAGSSDTITVDALGSSVTGSLTINAGDGSDTVNLNSLDPSFSATVAVNGEAGDDTYNLSLDSIGSTTVTLTDSGGTDSLTVSGTSGPDDLTITDTNVSLTSGGAVNYTGVETLTVLAGDGADTVSATGSAAINMSLYGGDPSDSPGDTLIYTPPIDFFTEFENVQSPTITIVKEAVPDDTMDFSFTGTGGLGSFSLDDDADPTLPKSKTFSGLNPGTYDVTEGMTTGWELTGISCTDPDGGSTTDVVARKASIDLDAVESITCTFTNTRRHTLNVNKDGTGTGTVSSATAGINCGADCSEEYNYGTTVTLSANPDAGFVFSGWSGGGCSGTGNCQVTMNDNTTVTATFNMQYNLTVNKAGTGSGTVSSTPGGIACGADCSELYDSGTVVTLSTSPDAGCVFTSWFGGGCSGTGSCQVTMNDNTTVTATFTRQYTLTVDKAGTGSGTVSSAPVGIDCGADCGEVYDSGTVVTLSTSPDVSSGFSGWSGDPDCSDGQVTMDAPRSCTATFDLLQYAISGHVQTTEGVGISAVTMTGLPGNPITDAAGFYSSVVDYGWSGTVRPQKGDYSFNPPSRDYTNVTSDHLDQDYTGTLLTRYELSVNVDPVGGGMVTGMGISCPEDCDETYDEGTMVKLNAIPAPGYVFDSWEGCAAPRSQCDVTMDSDLGVTAHFRESHRLEVKAIPSVGGMVSGEGIECPNDCEEDYPTPTLVALTAQPNDGFIFTGFEGCDSVENNQCIISVGSEETVRALFAPETGRSVIYSEAVNIFLSKWMLYMPVLQAEFEGGEVETYWMLLEYVWPGGYFAVVDYGQTAGPGTAEGASLVLEDGVWRIYIPGCEVEWDPGRLYWLTLEVDFTDTGFIVNIIEYGLVE